MPIDSRYVSASDLQTVLRDKTTGLPLRNGYIEFYEDDSRTTPKDVFMLSGSPPNYSFTNIGSTVTLSGAGTVQYNSNDIILYYFPYDDNGDVQRYFVEVFNSADESQFTREGWPPNIADESSNQTHFTNYIPNGQFLLHNNLPETTTEEEGEIRADSTEIAPNGWTFERPSGSTSTNFVTFERLPGNETNPTTFPRYKVRVRCTNPGGGDAYKDLRIKFKDVNKFASLTQQYTYSCTARDENGATVTVYAYLIKNFGSGGSTQTETQLAEFPLTSAYAIKQTTFVFGENTDKTIGADDDDYVQLAIRFPLNAQFDITLDNFILTPGAVNIELFPPTPDRQFIRDSLIPPVPDYDGMNLYLPLILTQNGLAYDDSEIGMVYLDSTGTTTPPETMLEGNGDRYLTTAYSSVGIPYLRLQQKYWIDSLNKPRYGTGTEYITADITNTTDTMIITTNDMGAVTGAADGTAMTGFTFATIHDGGDYEYNAYRETADSIIMIGTVAGEVNALPSAGTSGFTIVSDAYVDSVSDVKFIFTVEVIAASTLAGTYFTFSDTTTDYYVWFKVDGAGSDPAPGGTGIQVDLLSTYTAPTVALILSYAMGGWQQESIVTGAASTFSGGAYFTLNSLTEGYYVWYTKDGAGTDPMVASRIGIQVDVLAADTAAEVAEKTQVAINSKYFAVPDYRGVFFRSTDDGRNLEDGADRRLSRIGTLYGDELGTYQFDINQQHFHYVNKAGLPGQQAIWGDGTSPDPAGAVAHDQANSADPVSTIDSGGDEARSKNMSIRAYIKY